MRMVWVALLVEGAILAAQAAIWAAHPTSVIAAAGTGFDAGVMLVTVVTLTIIAVLRRA